jgi:hypothetical protein
VQQRKKRRSVSTGAIFSASKWGGVVQYLALVQKLAPASEVVQFH